MKNMMKSAFWLGLILLLVGTTQKASAQTEDVSLQSFYDELSPYGTWIQDPQYGYVWRPDVDQEEFRPYYTNGRWVMTEYGNTWVSNYDWGWAPFHYGRWVYNNYNQWVWLPDTVWGPAWVSWRSGGGNYGWAPLGPSISIGINIGRGGYRIPDMCWNFIPYGSIYYNSYPRYNYGRNRVYIQNTVIINNTYVRNNRTYYSGPRIDDIRRQTNQRVNVYAVNRSHSNTGSRIENNRVNIYQPRAGRDANNSNPAPRNVVQGNINRGTVGRDNNVSANRGDSRSDNNRYDGNRGDVKSNNGQIDRNSNNNTRPSRSENGTGAGQGRDNNSRVGVSPPNENNNTVGQRPNIFRDRENGAQPQRVERGNNNAQPQAQPQQQRVERNREVPQAQPQQQRVERSREVPQQQAQPQRVERQPQQQAPQRMERSQSQPQQQQRVERPQTQQSQPQQNRGGSESRGGGREGAGGRPGRG
jgi:hypothetical protein